MGSNPALSANGALYWNPVQGKFAIEGRNSPRPGPTIAGLGECPPGVIGSRGRPKSDCRKACGFESRGGYDGIASVCIRALCRAPRSDSSGRVFGGSIRKSAQEHVLKT